MDGAARIVAQREIFKSTTSAHVADWEMTPKKTSLRSARPATKRDIYAAKPPDYFVTRLPMSAAGIR
jgi:hypothetical protein